MKTLKNGTRVIVHDHFYEGMMGIIVEACYDGDNNLYGVIFDNLAEDGSDGALVMATELEPID